MDNVSIIFAFTAGLGSFLSPCVVPLVPTYFASLYGPELLDTGVTRSRITLFLHSLSFVIGFSLLFTTLGAIAGISGYAINLNSALLNTIAGSLLIAFGLFMLAALKVPWLNYEKRLNVSLSNTTGFFRSFLIGAIFSMGWTACVGPILAGILALASVQATAWQGAYLLAIYSLGLGLPFLVIGAAFDSLTPLLRRISRYTRVIYVISSFLLITVGILVLTGRISWLISRIA